MAIYHCSVKNVSRRSGRSAVAAASYRSGECLIEAATGRLLACRHDLGGVEHVQLIGWTRSREELWNAAEAAEKRKDARTAKEIEIALPAELDHLQRIALAVDYAEELRKRYGVALDVALHEPSNGGTNYHAHILMTTREVNDKRLGKKVRKLDSKRELEAIRTLWQDVANTHLARAGEKQHIDCRSLKAQGIDRIPTIHEGYNGHPQKYGRMAMNAEIKDINKQARNVKILQAEFVKDVRQLLVFTARTIQAAPPLIHEAYDYVRRAVQFMTYSFRARETNGRKRRNRKIAEYKNHQKRETQNVCQTVRRDREEGEGYQYGFS